MSWQWIPSQIDVFTGEDALDYADDNYYDFRPGYFEGRGRDAGLYLIYHDSYNSRNNQSYSVISSTNNWMIVADPRVCFKVSSYTSSDTFIEETIFHPGGMGDGGASQPYIGQEQQVYYGKPVYWGGSFHLFYSVSEDAYIVQQNYNRTIVCEPVYSTNTLSGGISGDWFWKSSASDLDTYTGISYNQVSPLYFDVAGAVDQYKWYQGSDYVDHLRLLPFMEYYQYSSPAEISALDEWPAGEYTNPTTGETKIVGAKCYKGSDNSVWRGHRIGRTGSSGEYWQSEEWGGYSKRLRFYTNVAQYGDCWATVFSSARHEPYFVYPNALSSLPESFTLQRYEWDTDANDYAHVTSADITLTLGPYQILSSESSVLMGEFSQWR